LFIEIQFNLIPNPATTLMYFLKET